MSLATTQTNPFSLIAVHGNGGGGFRFARSAPFVPDHVYFEAVTLPGFASVPADPTLQSVPDYAQRLHEMTAGLPGPRVLLGTGIGGTIALQYAQTYADAIDGLILHAPVGTRLDERLFPRLMKLPGAKRAGQWLFSARLMEPLWRRLLFHHPVPDDYMRQFFVEYRNCQVFGQMFDIINNAWFEQLKPIDVPTALLWGELERVLSVDQLDDYKRLLPTHLVKTVPDWDHFPMIEQPQEFADVTVALAQELITMRA